jgi:hypothetical protein
VPCAEGLTPVAAGAGSNRAVPHAVALLLALLASGCSPSPETATPAASSRAPAGSPGATAASGGPAEGRPAEGRSVPQPGNARASGAPAKAPPRRTAQASPSGADWDAYRRQAAERIVAMNPEGTYGGPVPEPLLAIPVLEIALNGDGSVRRIQVLRQPGQALDTVQLAMAAVRRAAPFAPVSQLPQPWVFTETFLFDGQRRFKPRSLDL